MMYHAEKKTWNAEWDVRVDKIVAAAEEKTVGWRRSKFISVEAVEGAVQIKIPKSRKILIIYSVRADIISSEILSI